MEKLLGKMTAEEVLCDYWQKKPCLIRQALPGFEPPLDQDDIAGLAWEEMAESRLVTGRYPGPQASGSLSSTKSRVFIASVSCRTSSGLKLDGSGAVSPISSCTTNFITSGTAAEPAG